MKHMKVLCAVDGSEFSRWGAEALAALVEQPPEALVLLHVLDTAALKALGRKKQINLKQSLSALELEGSKLLRQLAPDRQTHTQSTSHWSSHKGPYGPRPGRGGAHHREPGETEAGGPADRWFPRA